jgi:polysaccharide export outer membrane protein
MWLSALGAVGALCLLGTGCLHTSCPAPDVPRELHSVSLPPYVVEPPDILLIDTLSIIPKPPYKLEALDVLLIQVTPTFPDAPINGTFSVNPEGTVELGLRYGAVQVAGKTLQEARDAMTRHLSEILTKPVVTVSLYQFHGMQQIRGEHLVRPDGTVSLGLYGNVAVAYMTLDQIKAAIERHLGQFLLDPKISIDVFAYNSKWIYIIADGAGYGQIVSRLPIVGKETVLDAISQIGGLPLIASQYHIWVSRPSPQDCGNEQILPVDWVGITQAGRVETNYQLAPGDRVFVQSQEIVRVNNILGKALAPIERILGVSLLGTSAIQGVQQIGILQQTLARGGASAGVITQGGTIVGTGTR